MITLLGENGIANNVWPLPKHLYPTLKSPKRSVCGYLQRTTLEVLLPSFLPEHRFQRGALRPDSPDGAGEHFSFIKSLVRNQAEFAVSSEMMILNKESPYFWNSTPTGMVVFWEQSILKFQENRFWKFSEIKENHYIIDYEKEIHHRADVRICVLFINALSSPI